MGRKAFARAWRFLSYKAGAKWTALLSALLAGLLYVAFLVILTLFADLLVHRGRIPTFAELSRYERQQFESSWDDLLSMETRQQSFQNIGVDEKTAGTLAKVERLAELPPGDQDLAWRSQVFDLLRSRVGPPAAVLVLPDFRDLPEPTQEGFRAQWTAIPPEQRAGQLQVLGDQGTRLARRDFQVMTPAEKELLWESHLYRGLDSAFGPDVAGDYLDDRLRRTQSAEAPESGGNRELADRGLLSLVARSNNPVFGTALGWIARVSPWTWKTGSPTHPNFLYYLTGLLIVALVLALIRALATFGLHYFAAVATVEATSRFRRAVYHHTYRLGTLAIRALGPSEAVSVFTRQLEAVQEGLYTGLTVMTREPVKFVLLLLCALALNVWLTLAFLFFALLVWLLGGQIAVYFRGQERAATRAAAEQLALLQESLMMMRLVKTYLMEPFNQARVERQLARYSYAQRRRNRGEAIYGPLWIGLGMLAAVILLYVTGLIVISGRLGVAPAISLATALVSLYWPVMNFVDNRRLIRRADRAAAILFEFLDRPGEVGQVLGAEFLGPLSKRLEFDSVSLLEPGTGRKLLENVSLTIQAGQRVALVGPEEMEKHALVYLIPRFLDPNSGEIRFDNHNLRFVTLDSLRVQISLVMQNNLVFNDSVANNIGCGDPSYDLPKIIQAAKMAHAHHFIQKLSKGYETPIGELGHYLNSGEKFRIALARAILRDPALVIFEEPYQPLDDDTKALVDDTYSRFLPGRTVIFLPHRITTIRNCDRVFLLHEGRIGDAGEHRELLGRNELYKHLQYLEFNAYADLLGAKAPLPPA